MCIRDRDITMADLLPALYYRLAHNAELRGKDPGRAERLYGEHGIEEDQLDALLHMAPLALFHAYTDVQAAQRLLSHSGYSLILAETSEETTDRPVFYLAADDARRRVVIMVRGSSGAVDWLSNAEFGTTEVILPTGERGAAHAGMLRRAEVLLQMMRPALEQF
eukprot:TRINITY_DN53185_c0_g2_i1.p1 TRINITY_DN53185_c0_g2~~TRINITY_DN53185_c0_g2_i1.p1  ORF type:complete len:164 (+),score=43.61 TRINITY_DN53185_c0_g2_i1:72-563(+)